MNEDQELLDRFAIAALPTVLQMTGGDPRNIVEPIFDLAWGIAIAMKQARDRICTTAKPAEMDPGPFPKIDMET